MGYSFVIENGYRIVKPGQYPWPWSGDAARTIELCEDDVLTRSPDGTFMRQTGLGCLNIRLRDDQVEPIGHPVQLELM
jgi:hypothetical protein